MTLSPSWTLKTEIAATVRAEQAAYFSLCMHASTSGLCFATCNTGVAYTGRRIGKASGEYPSSHEGNWPGVGRHPALVVPGSRCAIVFHSDRSINDWGWRVTVTAQVPVTTLAAGREQGILPNDGPFWMGAVQQVGVCGSQVLRSAVAHAVCLAARTYRAQARSTAQS